MAEVLGFAIEFSLNGRGFSLFTAANEERIAKSAMSGPFYPVIIADRRACGRRLERLFDQLFLEGARLRRFS